MKWGEYMDEEEKYNNNNNDKGAMDTIKDTAKKETKKVMKKGVKKVIKLALPYIGMFILCLLAIGLIMATISSILNFFAGLLGVDADSLSSSNDATIEKSQKIISITDEGYKLNDDYSEKILEDLESQKVDTEIMEFSTEDLSDMIDKYIKAEIKTMYPTIGKGDVDGLVKIQRMSAETGTTTPLTYVDYDEFINKVETSDVSVLNNFSLNPDTFELCLAYSKVVIYYDYDNGTRKEVNRTTIILKREIEYQTALQSYATPLNYFISMHMICADKNFMNDLVTMVDEKTDIVLTFVESTFKEFVQVDYEGEITTFYYENNPIINKEPNPLYPDDPHAPAYIEHIIGYSHSLTGTDEKTVTTGNISEYNQYITPKQYVIENVYNAGDLKVTRANTWRLQSQLNIQKNEMIREDIQIDNISNEVNIDEYDTVVWDREYSGSYNTGWIKEITDEWTENYNISSNEMAGGYELTEFIDLIKQENYSRVRNNLETAPSLLFYLLEQNENTQELSSVMRYVLLLLTEKSYGVTEEDLQNLLQMENSIGDASYSESGGGVLWWPVEEGASFRISSYFGLRESPGGIGSTNHKGIDIAIVQGTKIIASADGIVEISTSSASAGLYIRIDHQNGLKTVYMHNSQLLVSAGQEVKRGDVIALSGNTGNSTGPHLHFGVMLNGQYVDPLSYVNPGNPRPEVGNYSGAVPTDDMDLIYAIVASECASSYEGSLAVISCVLNRCDQNWGNHGTDPLSQITARGQFSYGIDKYKNAHKKYLNGKAPEHTKRAVNDAISGRARNHSYTSFRTDSAKARTNHPNGKSIGGNWFFN